jgi:UDP-3-O-[3-hydroxymyristoyl] glucosamine N-acyltransferase
VSQSFRLAELADHLGAEVVGSPAKVVSRVRALDQAGAGDLSFLHNPKYLDQARSSKAGAILVKHSDQLPGRDLLVVDEPYLAFARALELMHPHEWPEPGRHPSAVIADDAALGEGVAIGPHVTIGAGCRIGSGTRVEAGCVLGQQVVIGDGCYLHPRVVVENGSRIGNRCILHAGVVIGSDGYGFATVAGVHHKVPQIGIVVLEDDVELGANVCVDRGTTGETRVGRGTKVDNLVQIGHNVKIGEGCLLVSQVGLSGSTELGDHVTMAGQSGAAGHLRLGDRVIVGAKSAVYKNVPDGAFVTGIPAQPHREWLKSSANLRRIESLRDRLKELEEAVARLQGEEA